MTSDPSIAEGVVLVEQIGDVLRVTLNRPRKYNAIDRQTLELLGSILGIVATGSHVRCVILTGAGKAFAAGADIAGYHGVGLEELGEFTELANAVCKRLRECPVPVIAAVNGIALGGGFELAMNCDFIVASRSAKFGLPELSLGLIPGWGGTQLLTKLIGRGSALEAILVGQRFDADTARQLGIVARVSEPERLEEDALAFATQIAELPAAAVRSAKRAVSCAAEFSGAASVVEKEELIALFGTRDGREGVAAFVEKRPAVWQASAAGSLC
jgi:enoyl-CoA hydratase/carnithine racemase